MSGLDAYSERSFKEAFAGLLESIVLNPRLQPSDAPSAVLLGGQSGAGKSTLHAIYKTAYQDNVIVVNGDEYRKLHPHFAQIQERYGIDAPAHTAAWAGAMVEALVNAFSLQGYNLIIEGTLRTAETPSNTARLLRERGYAVSLAVMAVKPEISLVSCQIRYEQLRLAGTTPRAVDPAHHAAIVDAIVSNMAQLERSELFDSISLYDRAGTCLFSGTCPMPDPAASEALRSVLFGDWTLDELEHYEALQQQLLELQGQ